MIALAAIVVTALLVAYWARFRAWSQPTSLHSTFVLLPLMLLLLIVTGQDQDSLDSSGAPVLLAIAADVSLSMGTLPEPAAHGDVGTRLERSRRALVPLLASLGAAARPALISVTAFTVKSETILAWDDDLSLVREIIEYVLSTGLLTEAGSDLGTALHGVLPLFESLPEGDRVPERTKYLIIVSDGEQTAANADSALAIAKLRDLGVKIIALHVGLQDVPEGLPVYDEGENFIGFEEVNGQIFSVPDAEFMHALAGDDSAEGLFVSAESNNAATGIMDFIGLQSDRSAAGRLRIGAVIVLWGLLLLALLRWV